VTILEFCLDHHIATSRRTTLIGRATCQRIRIPVLGRWARDLSLAPFIKIKQLV
jgi:hypothetical protein